MILCMMNVLEIANHIYDKQVTKSYKDLVVNYEKYKSIIENVDYTAFDEQFDAFLKLTIDYSIALSEIGDYNRSLPYINKSIELFNADKKYAPEDLFNLRTYELLLWHRGKGNYIIKNYSLSKNDFETLVKHYPENKQYRNWLIGIDNVNHNLIKKIFLYILFGSVVLGFFLHGNIKNVFFGIGLFSFIGAFFLEIVWQFRKHKNK